jgi:hypothetical protein
MAAREDQAQPVVAHRALVGRLLGARNPFDWLVAGVQQRRLGVALIARGFAAQAIDRPVAGGGDDPPGRARRQPFGRPAPDGDRERVLDRFLGDVDVAEDADQDRHGASVLLAEHTLDVRNLDAGHARDQPLGVSWNERTSIGRVVARANLPAHSSALSRSGASTIVKPPMCSLPST